MRFVQYLSGALSKFDRESRWVVDLHGLCMSYHPGQDKCMEVTWTLVLSAREGMMGNLRCW